MEIALLINKYEEMLADENRRIEMFNDREERELEVLESVERKKVLEMILEDLKTLRNK